MGVTALEPQVAVMITPVTLDLLELTLGQTMSRQLCWGQRVCSPYLQASLVGTRPDTFFLGKPSGWGAAGTGL